MHQTPNPDPDLAAVPGRRVLGGLSLAAAALIVAQLVTVPGVVAALAGFAAIVVLPVIVVSLVVRTGIAILEFSLGRNELQNTTSEPSESVTSVDTAQPAD